MELKSSFAEETQEKIRQLCLKQASGASLQDDFGLYIPPSARLAQYSSSSFDLTSSINDFIENSHRVLLLLGDSGCGKSFFAQALIKRKSEEFRFGGRIPLFVSLPTLRNAKTSLMKEALELHGFIENEIELLRTTQKFLLIFDAYDELNSFDNLYMSNSMAEWDAKIITTCRTDYLVQDDNYKCYFMPYHMHKPLEDAIQVLFIAPFVRGQIEQYIIQYLQVKRQGLLEEILIRPELSKDWLAVKAYESWIERLPGLKELVSQPFLLRITMEVLPEVVVELQANPENFQKFKMTSAKLYDHFVDQWIRRQQNKLSIKLINRGEFLPPTFHKDCINFSKALGKKMHDKKMDVVYYEDHAMEFFDEGDQGNGLNKEMAQWALFFSDEMVPQDKGSEERRQNRIRIRKASMLKKVGVCQWAFMHASLRDYFMSLNIANPKLMVQSEKSSPHEPISPRSEQNVGAKFSLFHRLSPRAVAAEHRVVGSYCLMNRFNKQEAVELLQDEGINIVFKAGDANQKVVIGRGSFGKIRIARHLFSHRFAGVKKIRGELKIKGSASEAEFQRELNGLPNVMPIWDSQMIRSKKKGEDVLLQFMPLAGFGNGGQLVELMGYIENSDLKRQFLVHVLKSMLTGVKGLHSRKVYHLDIKLPNIVLDCLGEVYLIDFGCAYREYGNKSNALISGGRGDYEYYSPDRLAHNKKISQKQMAEENYKPENYHGEKADIWAVGISLLKLYMQDLYFMSGVGTSSDWVTYLKQGFHEVPGWDDAPENSVLGCVKALLQIEPLQRPSAAEALKNPLFSDAQNQLAPDKLKQLMLQLIQWKTDPPVLAGIREKGLEFSK